MKVSSKVNVVSFMLSNVIVNKNTMAKRHVEDILYDESFQNKKRDKKNKIWY